MTSLYLPSFETKGPAWVDLRGRIGISNVLLKVLVGTFRNKMRTNSMGRYQVKTLILVFMILSSIANADDSGAKSYKDQSDPNLTTGINSNDAPFQKLKTAADKRSVGASESLSKNDWTLSDGTNACCFGRGPMVCNGKNAYRLEAKDETGLSFSLTITGQGSKVSKIFEDRGKSNKSSEYRIINGKASQTNGARVIDTSMINSYMSEFNERLACCQNDGPQLAACLKKFNDSFSKNENSKQPDQKKKPSH